VSLLLSLDLLNLLCQKSKMKRLEATSHDSGGYKEFVSSNLVEVEDFSGTFAFISGNVSKYLGYLTLVVSLL
jgi:hypothetical protein